ncbi:MAG: 2'-deoxycytidine 5'-triphosphate deaminase [Deltaproteobacteria bacterium]|nr:2'-deoxycytidine 5'-triphosphate deaminase [Deltaproteobacteria bacterium]
MVEGTSEGIQASQWIRRAIAQGLVRGATPLQDGQVQPNSLDLRLGQAAWRLQCSVLPGEEGMEKKLARHAWSALPVTDQGLLLERNAVYLFALQESLDLPPGLSARGNAKSSTGRLDLFTRLLTERGTTFDEVPDGYRGRLFLEVIPRSFAIVVRPGDSLAQLRFQCGTPDLDDDALRRALDTEALVTDEVGTPVGARRLKVGRGVYLSVKLQKAGETVGYRALKNTNPIDLRALGSYPVKRYWQPLAWSPEEPVILEPNEFYIFASRELVRLPPAFCAEMVAFDPNAGELRTHYAGFFDSGFGYARDLPPARSAAAVVLEIRNHDVPFLLEDGNPLFRLVFFKNSEPPDRLYGQALGSNYQGQRLKLGKQFAQP